MNCLDSPISERPQFPIIKNSNDGLVNSSTAQQTSQILRRSASATSLFPESISFTSDALGDHKIELGNCQSPTAFPGDLISSPYPFAFSDSPKPLENEVGTNDFFMSPLALTSPSRTQKNPHESFSIHDCLLPVVTNCGNEDFQINSTLDSEPPSTSFPVQSEPVDYDFGLSSNLYSPHCIDGGTAVNPMDGPPTQNEKRKSASKTGSDEVSKSNGNVSSGRKRRSKGNGANSNCVPKLATQTAMTLKEQRARRNRESAKRSRIKNKLYFEKLEATFFEVSDENRSLKQVIENLLPPCLETSAELRSQLQELFDLNPTFRLT